MQNLFKYRFLVVLFLLCGLFLIVSVANTVKRNTMEYQVTEINQTGLSFDTIPGEKGADTSYRKDTAFMDGKSWRIDNELYIMY